MVAGADGDAEFRPADARSGTGPQEGLEDGHHPLADLEHSGDVDRPAGGVAQGELPDGSRQVSLRSNATWVPARPRSVSSLHLRALCARHQARRAAGHAAAGRRHP